MTQTNEEYINEESTQNQCAKILGYIREHGSITAIEALNLCGCFRLSARIHDLRHKFGWDIVSERVIRNGKHVAQYSLSA